MICEPIHWKTLWLLQIALAHSLRPRTRKRQCTARRADQLEAESKIPENIRAPLSSVSRRNLCNLVTDNALLNDEVTPTGT